MPASYRKITGVEYLSTSNPAFGTGGVIFYQVGGVHKDADQSVEQ